MKKDEPVCNQILVVTFLVALQAKVDSLTTVSSVDVA